MPLCSAFTPFGALTFSSRQSVPENVFRAIQEAQAGIYEEGGHQEARLYAAAMAIGSALGTISRVRESFDPLNAAEDIIEKVEADYGLIPSQSATIWDRRAALAAARVLLLGARADAIEEGLGLILGSDFVAYRTTTAAEAAASPTDPGAGGSFVPPSTPTKLVTIPNGVSTLGLHEFAYQYLGGSTEALKAGEELVVEPGRLGCCETVEIVSAGVGVASATFTRGHDVGCQALVGHHPLWVSTKRHSLIVTSYAASSDPAKRKAVNEFMTKAARGVSTWAITSEETYGTAGYTGAFTVGGGRIGITTIGEVEI